MPDDLREVARELSRAVEVERFAKLMKLKLAVNSHKGGWQDCDPEYLYYRLVEEVGELGRAIFGTRGGDIGCEAADVANFAMMIEDVMRRRSAWAPEPAATTGYLQTDAPPCPACGQIQVPSGPPWRCLGCQPPASTGKESPCIPTN